MQKAKAGKEEIILENKMGYMPIPRLLYSMALPMMISMFVQALYNIVDSIFVARLSEQALTSVSLAFPMQNLMIGVGTGIGIGTNALLSRKLGEKDFETADRSAMQGIFLSACAFALFALVGLTLVGPFFRGQTQAPEIIDGGISYLRIICICSAGLFGQMIMERLLQSTGMTFYSMITQTTGAVINIILDPIMIFGLLGFPRMGIAGAAAATVIGQVSAALLAVYFNLTKNKELHFRLQNLRPDPAMIRQILLIGVPSLIMVAIGSVMTFFMNRILGQFTSTAVAVFGIFFRMQSFIMMPVFGLNGGMIPIIAYNYGAKNRERIIETIRLGIITAMGIMLAGLLLLQLFPQKMLLLFDASESMMSIGVPAFRIISLSFIMAGYSIVASSVFQAFGESILSMIMSLVRQLFVLLPAAWLLARMGDVNLVWWAWPLAELAAVAISSIFLRRVNRDIISGLESGKTGRSEV